MFRVIGKAKRAQISFDKIKLFFLQRLLFSILLKCVFADIESCMMIVTSQTR